MATSYDKTTSVREEADNGVKIQRGFEPVTGATTGTITTGLSTVDDARIAPYSGDSASCASVTVKWSNGTLYYETYGPSGVVTYRWEAVGQL